MRTVFVLFLYSGYKFSGMWKLAGPFAKVTYYDVIYYYYTPYSPTITPYSPTIVVISFSMLQTSCLEHSVNIVKIIDCFLNVYLSSVKDMTPVNSRTSLNSVLSATGNPESEESMGKCCIK